MYLPFALSFLLGHVSHKHFRVLAQTELNYPLHFTPSPAILHYSQ